MRQILAPAASKTYKFKMTVFENVRPEELPGFLKNFKNFIDGNRTTIVSGRINYLRTLVCGEALR